MEFEDFKKSREECAKSFEKWAKESGFDPSIICSVVLDFYVTWELLQDSPESKVLDFVSEIYNVNFLLRKCKSVAEDQSVSDRDGEPGLFSEKNLDKFSDILEKMIQLEKMRS